MTENTQTATEPAPTESVPQNDAMESDAALSAIYDKITAEKTEDAPTETKAEEPAEPVEAAPVEGETESAPEGADETDQLDDAEGEPQEETAAIAVPASWSKEVGEHWATLPPTVQEYVAQREQDSTRKISEQSAQIKSMEPIVSVAQRYQQNFDRHGVSFEQGMEALMNAQAILDRDPLQGLAAIAQTYGIDLAQTFGPAYQQMDPALKQLVEQNRVQQAHIQNLQRDQRAVEAAEQRSSQDQADAAIDQWLNSGDKPYFEKVEDTMALLIQEGRASDLDTAYDMACHADPTIRAEIAAAEKAKADEEAQKQAQKAQLEAARAAKEAKKKAATNSGNRSTPTSIISGDFLDTDQLSANYDRIVSG